MSPFLDTRPREILDTRHHEILTSISLTMIECPICHLSFPSVNALVSHIRDGSHPNVELLLHTEQFRSYNLYTCPNCTHPSISCGQQGFSLHQRNSHLRRPSPHAPRPPNSTLLKDAFLSSNNHDNWIDLLQWLLSLQDFPPPPFRHSLLYKINHSLRQQVLDIFLILLHKIVIATDATPPDPSTPDYESSTLPLLTLFLLLESVLLSPPLSNEPRKYKKLIPLRLQAFRQGRFRQLYENLHAHQPLPPSSPQMSPSILSPDIIDRTVTAAVRHGDYSAALKRLDPEPRAILNDTYLSILKNLHPPALHPSHHNPISPPTDVSIFKLDLLHITAQRSFRGKAPGFLGDSPDLLLDLMKCSLPDNSSITGSHLLHHLADLFLTGQVPPQAWLLLRDNVLVALHKDFPAHPDKLRPIGIGTSFRRLLLRHMIKASNQAITLHSLPTQFALGTSGGADFIIHSLMAALHAVDHPSSNPFERIAILKLDFVNMFNSVSRSITRQELQHHFPQWLWIFDNLYPPEGNRVWYQHADGHWDSFLQVEGFAQGCPGSPFFSSLPLRKLLTELQTQLNQRASLPTSPAPSFSVAFMDDTFAVARLCDIAFIFKFLQDHGPASGLVLHPSKCQILLTTTGISPLSSFPSQLQSELNWAASTFCNHHFALHGLEILGTPIGHTSFITTHLSKFIQSFERTTNLLTERISDPQIRFRLFLACLQHRTPSRQFADALLPTTSLTPTCSTSNLISNITTISSNFLSNLTGTHPFPPHAWSLATLPVREGGLGVLDPSTTAINAFIRPILRSLRSALLGFAIPAYPNSQANLSSDPDDSSTIWISLPSYLNASLPNWQSSPIPWLRRFTQLLTAISPHAGHDSSDLSSFFTRDSSPFPDLKQAQLTLHLSAYQQLAQHFPPSVSTAIFSLRSKTTSIALTTLPLHIPSYRLTPPLFVTALCRKLRLPILASPLPCSCGKSFDIFGDHVFSCPKHNKAALHNRIRDTFFLVFRNILPYTAITTSEHDTICEPTSLLPEFPSLRPADVAVHVQPGSLPIALSLLLFDFTSIPMLTSPTPVTCDPSLHHVTNHHEYYENLKFTGRRRSSSPTGAVTAAILRHRYGLIPVTFDPGGQLGPTISALLWGSTQRPSTGLFSNLASRSTTGLSSPAATQALDLTKKLSHVALLPKANKGWHRHAPSTQFARHYTATTPSQWALQAIGHNLVIAHTEHLLQALSSLRSRSTLSRSFYNVAIYDTSRKHHSSSLPHVYNSVLPIPSRSSPTTVIPPS